MNIYTSVLYITSTANSNLQIFNIKFEHKLYVMTIYFFCTVDIMIRVSEKTTWLYMYMYVFSEIH